MGEGMADGKIEQTRWEHEALTQQIIGAAIQVHRTLGPGFLESVYENALVVELRKRGLLVEQQVVVPIFYDGVHVGEHRLDLLVERLVVLELKAISAIEKVHYAIVRSYLKATDRPLALLLNFGESPLNIRRVARRG